MGSRWFKMAFGSMVLFSLIMMSRFASKGVDNVNRTLSPYELCTAFAQDYDAAVDMYCNNYITIDGTVDVVKGDDYPTSLVFISNRDKGQVECFLRQNRKYNPSGFYESQIVSIKGWLDEDDQKPGNLVVKKCKLLFY